MMFKIGAFFSISVHGILASCPIGWIENKGSCFFLSAEKHDFYDCQVNVCEPIGASMPCIGSEKENEFLAKNIDDGFFVGAYRSGCKWKWTSSECKSKFTDWAPGEPSDTNDDEDCAEMNSAYQGGQWNDLSCSEELSCVCQKGLTTAEDFKETSMGSSEGYCGPLWAALVLGLVIGVFVVPCAAFYFVQRRFESIDPDSRNEPAHPTCGLSELTRGGHVYASVCVWASFLMIPVVVVYWSVYGSVVNWAGYYIIPGGIVFTSRLFCIVKGALSKPDMGRERCAVYTWVVLYMLRCVHAIFTVLEVGQQDGVVVFAFLACPSVMVTEASIIVGLQGVIRLKHSRTYMVSPGPAPSERPAPPADIEVQTIVPARVVPAEATVVDHEHMATATVIEATPGVSTGVTTAPLSLSERLRQLQDAHESGLITEEEYSASRTRALQSLSKTAGS